MRWLPWLREYFSELLAGAGLLVNVTAWAVGAIGEDDTVVTALLTHAPPLVFVAPAAAVLASTLWFAVAARALALLRTRRALAIAVTSVLIALGPLGGFAIPRSSPDSEPKLAVFTYNVEKWSHGAARIAEVLADARPDVFCLQEAGDYPYVPNGAGQLRDFAARLREYRLVQKGELMIGTRLPLVRQQVIPLPIGPDSRPLLEVTVRSPSGAEVTVLTAHLLYTAYFALSPAGLRDAARARLAQAEAILARASVVRGPLVVCGDLNASRRSAALRRLKTNLRDAWSERGLGFGLTMTARFPTRRIDYVLARDLDVQTVSVLDVDASDHRPVLAVLGLPRTPGAP